MTASDFWADAPVIYLPTTGSVYSSGFPTDDFTQESSEPITSDFSKTGWLKYTPLTSGTISVDVTGSPAGTIDDDNFYSQVAVSLMEHSGAPGPPDVTTMTPLAGWFGFQSELGVTGGQDYWIQCSTRDIGGAVGYVALEVIGLASEPPPPPPPEDPLPGDFPWSDPDTEMPPIPYVDGLPGVGDPYGMGGDPADPDGPGGDPPGDEPTWLDGSIPSADAPADTESGSANLLDLVREFSGAVRRPVRVVNSTTIEMVDINQPSVIAQSEATAMYRDAQLRVSIGARALALEDDLAEADASATLRDDDAQLLVSGWRLPAQLPLLGARPAPVQRVSLEFTPDGMSGELEFNLPTPPPIIRRGAST